MDFHELALAHPQTAQRLLGCELLVTDHETTTRCTIAETEFYREDDPASHTYRGKTVRNQSMFLAAGHAYVYFIYGMHYCLNIVSGPEGVGCGVLIRGGLIDGNRVEGPARLTKKLDVDRRFDGHDLARPPLQLKLKPPVPNRNVSVTPRVGISKAIEQPWRYILKS